MRFKDFVARYPNCYHLTAAGAWPHIQRYGLLSTSAVLAQHGRPSDDPAATQHRPTGVALAATDDLPGVLIRDQIPLSTIQLPNVLTDMTPDEWIAALNARVFFFVRRDDALALSNARAYREQQHELLTLNTRSLVNTHASRVELAHLNTGTVQRASGKRGSDTFTSIDTYKGTLSSVKELLVRDGVTPLTPHVLTVETVHAGGAAGTVWTAPVDED